MTGRMKKIKFLMFAALFAAVCAGFGSCEKDDDDKNSKEENSNPFTYDEGAVINGVKWATRNVDVPGSFAANPEDAGMFYQWNSKIGWSSVDPMVNSSGGTTWGSPASSDTWQVTNDPSPSGWRVPTFAEIQSLLDTEKVVHESTTQNGQKGMLFTDKISGVSIFLPTAGYRRYSNGTLYPPVDSDDLRGNYWSSSWHNVNGAYDLYFIRNSFPDWGDSLPKYGYSIRPVEK
jgi:uncharacterized protein (TIGR02145 family)